MNDEDFTEDEVKDFLKRNPQGDYQDFLQERKTSQQKPEPSSQDGYLKPLLKTAVGSALFNFADEGYGAYDAGAALLKGEDAGEAYKKGKANYNKEVEDFAKDNPKSALAAQIGGGVLTAITPIGVAGSSLRFGAGALNASRAGKAIVEAGKSTSRALPLSRTVLRRGVPRQELTKRGLLAVGAAGGGLAAYGADQDISEGAAYGAAVPLGLRALGNTAKKVGSLVNDNVVKPLSDVLIPPTPNKLIQRTLSTIVENTPGGRDAINKRISELTPARINPVTGEREKVGIGAVLMDALSPSAKENITRIIQQSDATNDEALRLVEKRAAGSARRAREDVANTLGVKPFETVKQARAPENELSRLERDRLIEEARKVFTIDDTNEALGLIYKTPKGKNIHNKVTKLIGQKGLLDQANNEEIILKAKLGKKIHVPFNGFDILDNMKREADNASGNYKNPLAGNKSDIASEVYGRIGNIIRDKIKQVPEGKNYLDHTGRYLLGEEAAEQGVKLGLNPKPETLQMLNDKIAKAGEISPEAQEFVRRAADKGLRVGDVENLTNKTTPASLNPYFDNTGREDIRRTLYTQEERDTIRGIGLREKAFDETDRFVKGAKNPGVTDGRSGNFIAQAITGLMQGGRTLASSPQHLANDLMSIARAKNAADAAPKLLQIMQSSEFPELPKRTRDIITELWRKANPPSGEGLSEALSLSIGRNQQNMDR